MLCKWVMLFPVCSISETKPCKIRYSIAVIVIREQYILTNGKIAAIKFADKHGSGLHSFLGRLDYLAIIVY